MTKERLKAVENKLVQNIYDALYLQGVSFKVIKFTLKSNRCFKRLWSNQVIQDKTSSMAIADTRG